MILDISLAMTHSSIRFRNTLVLLIPLNLLITVKSNVNVSTYLASFRFFMPLPKNQITEFNKQDDIQYLPSLKAYISEALDEWKTTRGPKAGLMGLILFQ